VTHDRGDTAPTSARPQLRSQISYPNLSLKCPVDVRRAVADTRWPAVSNCSSTTLHEVGAQAMTTEEIAGRSGVSKATIYKWWPNKHNGANEASAQEPDEYAERAHSSPVSDYRSELSRHRSMPESEA
jgi:DNA invertase Pin-like site-specific DNA recombinase